MTQCSCGGWMITCSRHIFTAQRSVQVSYMLLCSCFKTFGSTCIKRLITKSEIPEENQRRNQVEQSRYCSTKIPYSVGHTRCLMEILHVMIMRVGVFHWFRSGITNVSSVLVELLNGRDRDYSERSNTVGCSMKH